MGIPPSETVNEFEIIELDQIKISWSSQYMYIYIFNIISIKINIPRSSPIISVLYYQITKIGLYHFVCMHIKRIYFITTLNFNLKK